MMSSLADLVSFEDEITVEVPILRVLQAAYAAQHQSEIDRYQNDPDLPVPKTPALPRAIQKPWRPYGNAAAQTGRRAA